jgi:hypothetical protein
LHCSRKRQASPLLFAGSSYLGNNYAALVTVRIDNEARTHGMNKVRSGLSQRDIGATSSRS